MAVHMFAGVCVHLYIWDISIWMQGEGPCLPCLLHELRGTRVKTAFKANSMLCDNTLPICKVNDVSELEKVGDKWKNKCLLWLYKWVLVHKMNHRDYVNYVWAQTAWKGRD